MDTKLLKAISDAHNSPKLSEALTDNRKGLWLTPEHFAIAGLILVIWILLFSLVFLLIKHYKLKKRVKSNRIVLPNPVIELPNFLTNENFDNNQGNGDEANEEN